MLDREDLIELCESGSVTEDKWRDRDSAGAQRQLGECLMLLRAGCRWSYDKDLTNDDTIFINIIFKGFGYFDYGGDKDTKLFYIPTRKRIKGTIGRDWY